MAVNPNVLAMIANPTGGNNVLEMFSRGQEDAFRDEERGYIRRRQNAFLQAGEAARRGDWRGAGAAVAAVDPSAAHQYMSYADAQAEKAREEKLYNSLFGGGVSAAAPAASTGAVNVPTMRGPSGRAVIPTAAEAGGVAQQPQAQPQIQPQQGNMAKARALWATGDKAGAIKALYEGDDPGSWSTVTTEEGVFRVRGDGREKIFMGKPPRGEGQSFNQAEQLHDDFIKASDYYVKRRQAYSTIVEAAKDGTGVSDMALIYSFMKMLDPGSTVMMGEYATAEQTGSLPQNLVNIYNKLVSGGKLGPESSAMRQDFVRQAARMYSTTLDQYEASVKEYTERAQHLGIDPRSVLIDLTNGVPRPQFNATSQQFPQPTQSHVQALIQNPQRAAEFDAKFGRGAAGRYLGMSGR